MTIKESSKYILIFLTKLGGLLCIICRIAKQIISITIEIEGKKNKNSHIFLFLLCWLNECFYNLNYDFRSYLFDSYFSFVFLKESLIYESLIKCIIILKHISYTSIVSESFKDIWQLLECLIL